MSLWVIGSGLSAVCLRRESGMRITSCGMTDVGVKRTRNEDTFLINENLKLFICCDGMGGHVGGEYASAIAVNTIEEVLAGVQREDAVVSTDDSIDLSGESLRYAVRLAGRRIYEKAIEEPEYRGMGTTCLVLMLDNSNAYIAHVGDSRGYRLREGTIEQLTEDHSLVNERIRAGLLTVEEAKTHRLKNIITRSLGYMEDVEVDVSVHPIHTSDRFVLCSDGLSNLVDDDEIGELVAAHCPQESARRLISLACDRGGDDNITVVIVSINEHTQ